jgi:hypothetical protein
MSKTVHYVGLDVHKETIAVAIAPAEKTEVRHYGIINGTLRWRFLSGSVNAASTEKGVKIGAACAPFHVVFMFALLG